jgi:hypothetical protein
MSTPLTTPSIVRSVYITCEQCGQRSIIRVSGQGVSIVCPEHGLIFRYRVPKETSVISGYEWSGFTDLEVEMLKAIRQLSEDAGNTIADMRLQYGLLPAQGALAVAFLVLDACIASSQIEAAQVNQKTPALAQNSDEVRS